MTDPIQNLVEIIETAAKSACELDPDAFHTWAFETDFRSWFLGISDVVQEANFDPNAELEDGTWHGPNPNPGRDFCD